MSKTILVTGGTGFLGMPVVKLLLKDGWKVILLARGGVSVKERFFLGHHLEVIEGTLNDGDFLRKRLGRRRISAALHMAWEGIPNLGARMSSKNLQQSLSLYQLLADLKCPKVLTTGSCWEYATLNGKIHEDAALEWNHPFAIAKNALHYLGRKIAEESGMRFLWARLFYVYGPRQKASSLIPSLITGLKKNRRVQLKNPEFAGDFVHVNDVARALVEILNCRKMSTEVFNIGSGRLTSVGTIAGKVGKLLKISCKNRFPARSRGGWADVRKLKRETGWNPQISLESGIQGMLL